MCADMLCLSILPPRRRLRIFDKEKTCCFSGHRTEKLPDHGTLSSPAMRRLVSLLRLEIETALQSGYTNFISGMAKGIDLLAAELLLEQKSAHPNIRLICAVPYPRHADTFSGKDRYTYHLILERAAEVVTVSDAYSRSCMRKRNEYMVDRSGKLIAVVADFRSGTGQTIRYAQKQGLDVRVIDINIAGAILFPV